MQFLARAFLALSLLCLRPGTLRAQASLIILVRHAEKAATTGDPELTPAGEVRARDLARALTGVRLTAIITTQYRRTQLTAAPVALAKRLSPTVVAATGELSADASAIARALDLLPRGSAALVVGHSNTVGVIIAALGGPHVAELCDGEHATLLILERPPDGGEPQLLRTRYGAADPPGANECGGP